LRTKIEKIEEKRTKGTGDFWGRVKFLKRRKKFLGILPCPQSPF
jgi:hypothetical protein